MKTIVDENAQESGGVTAVMRAMRLLDAFRIDDAFVSLSELSRRTGLHKTTVLRLARTMAQAGYVAKRTDDGAWRLGPAAGWLGARYQASHDVNNVIEPVLRELTLLTSESASFFVREGDVRTCLVRVEGPQAIRHHIRVGEALPLDKGAPGRVLLAFGGKRGRIYDEIRREGYYMSIGERDPEIASVSAPVFGRHNRILGSISVSGPAVRLPRETLQRFAGTVIEKARALSYALGESSGQSKPFQTFWHP